jgi:hypothetical protein
VEAALWRKTSPFSPEQSREQKLVNWGFIMSTQQLVVAFHATLMTGKSSCNGFSFAFSFVLKM